jgi:hypothetical protein
VLAIMKTWNRAPTGGHRMTGIVFPNPDSRPFILDDDNVHLDFDAMARRSWFFILEDSAGFVETFKALRREGLVKPGDYLFAQIKRIGESCGAALVDREYLPDPQSISEGPADLVDILRRVQADGIFAITFGRQEKSRLRETLRTNPSLMRHLLSEFDAALGLKRHGRAARGMSEKLARIRRENQLSAAFRERRHVSPRGTDSDDSAQHRTKSH